MWLLTNLVSALLSVVAGLIVAIQSDRFSRRIMEHLVQPTFFPINYNLKLVVDDRFQSSNKVI